MVVKPVDGEQGQGVAVNLGTLEEIDQAVEQALRFDSRVLLESYHPGLDLRIVVIGFEVVAAAIRHPAQGGARMFTDHHWLTAHNSYVLTLAELGIVGMFLFVTLIYLSLKTLYVGLRELAKIPGTAAAQVWGMALMAGMCGITFQINTLSFAYHSVLWLFLGLTGAWYSAVRTHRPELEVKIKLGDFIALLAIVVGYAFVALPLWLKYKGVM